MDYQEIKNVYGHVAHVPNDSIQLIMECERARIAAWKNHDADTLRSMLADGYIEINQFGRRTAAEIFEDLFPHYSLYDLNTDGEQVVSLDVNTALLTYHCFESFEYKGEVTTGEFHVSSVYVKREETWKLLQWQITPFIRNE